MNSRREKALFFLGSSLLLLWPAFLNGYPYIFTDTIGYLDAGNCLALALLGKGWGSFGERSEVYSFSIYVLHLRRYLWFPALFSALLASWSVNRSVDVLLPQWTLRARLILVGGLSLFTSLSWRVSMVMPDYLAGLIPLWVYLLTRRSPVVTVRERVVLLGLLCYGGLCHPSHLALIAGLAFVLSVARKKESKWLWAVFLIACCTQITVHKVLRGEAKLFGHGPPLLLARVLADGPGVLYGREHPEFAVSRYVDLAEGRREENILWEEDGMFYQIKEDDPKAMRAIKAEENRFVIGAVLSYPFLQLQSSFKNFLTQSTYVGLGVEYETHPYIISCLPSILVRGEEIYHRTLQSRGAVPTLAFSVLQVIVLIGSVVVVARAIVGGWNELEAEWKHWLFTILAGVVLNAAITGVLSGAFARYQSRVIWLVPFTAAIIMAKRDGKGTTASHKSVPSE